MNSQPIAPPPVPEPAGAAPAPDGLPIGEVLADRLAARRRGPAERTLRDLSGVDRAVYLAIAETPTPSLDEPLRLLSNAANRSTLWLAIAGGLFAVGGRTGRRAAARGVLAIGTTSVLVNVGLKALHERERPDRAGASVPVARQVRMPSSSSFPSGHSASGFAFATAVGHEIPVLALPLRLLAAAVAYSRVHTGVHFPGDALAGSLVGGATGLIVSRLLDQREARAGRAPAPLPVTGSAHPAPRPDWTERPGVGAVQGTRS